MAIHRHSYPEFTDRHGSGPFFLPCKSDAIVRPAPEKQQHQQQSIKKRRMTPTTPQTVVFSKNPCFFFHSLLLHLQHSFFVGLSAFRLRSAVVVFVVVSVLSNSSPDRDNNEEWSVAHPSPPPQKSTGFFLKHEIITSESGSLLPTVPSGRTQSCS